MMINAASYYATQCKRRIGGKLRLGGPYGNYKWPTTQGSGGSTGFLAGGSGGAAVKLVALNSFVLDGTVDVSGGNGKSSTGYVHKASGGGAGGSVYILTQSFSGSGSVHASGGSGAVGYNGGYKSYSGGGGRIAVHCTGSRSFSMFQSKEKCVDL